MAALYLKANWKSKQKLNFGNPNRKKFEILENSKQTKQNFIFLSTENCKNLGNPNKNPGNQNEK
jgi:hypothetical protein